MTARCDHTDPPVDTCAHCLGHADPEAEERKERERLLESGHGWFRAQFSGVCEFCGERFEPGTAIRLEAPLGWRAECCARGAR